MTPAPDPSRPIFSLSRGKLPTLVSSIITFPASTLWSEASLLELSDTLLTAGTAGVFVLFPEGRVAFAFAATTLETAVTLTFC